MNRISRSSAVLFLFLLGSNQLSLAGSWKSNVPEIARQSAAWIELVSVLRTKGMPFGAMAGSARMLAFFSDLPSKEAAYHAVIELIDQGFPFPENKLFISGDLEESANSSGDANFVNSYNLMKYILNHEKGLDRWAKQYYERMDGEGFAKYQFYLAVQSYVKGGLDESADRLKKILALDPGVGSGALAIKTARMLARIYFEKKLYGKSLDIYTSFLLKMNPIHPSDWTEAAWNDYYLKRYPEALGLLYNLQSRAAGPVLSLEQYTLRALIYRENCAVHNAQLLTASFDRDFGATLVGLKNGDSPSKYPVLSQVETGSASPFRQLLDGMSALQKEALQIDVRIPEAIRPLARYVYDSETMLLQAELKGVSEVALDRAAEELVSTAEHLKFLRYDVARKKFDPDQVFRTPAATDIFQSGAPEIEGFQVHWPQSDQFWRSERLSFKGLVIQQCRD